MEYFLRSFNHRTAPPTHTFLWLLLLFNFTLITSNMNKCSILKVRSYRTIQKWKRVSLLPTLTPVPFLSPVRLYWWEVGCASSIDLSPATHTFFMSAFFPPNPEEHSLGNFAIMHCFSVDGLQQNHWGACLKSTLLGPSQICSVPRKGPRIFVLISFWR